jgi:hypothetical protein
VSARPSAGRAAVLGVARTLVARLCPECEAQLPPDFEVLKGDR